MISITSPSGTQIEYQDEKEMIERLENFESFPMNVVSNIRLQTNVKLLKEDKIKIDSFIENMEASGFKIDKIENN